jgi:hypothetical protein
MPPTDDSSIAARLGAFLTAMTASPPVPRLVSPTREFVEGLVELSAPWLAFLLKLSKVCVAYLCDLGVGFLTLCVTCKLGMVEVWGADLQGFRVGSAGLEHDTRYLLQ